MEGIGSVSSGDTCKASNAPDAGRSIRPNADYRSAFSLWVSHLGEHRVELDSEFLSRHGQNAAGAQNRAVGLLRPLTELEVKRTVEIAAEFKVPLYPISTGHNWGYGAASPSAPGCVIVDMSGMQTIRMIDSELGVVSVQPGVTQGLLYEWLVQQNADWMVPVHGGGPSCSILGNALERGYGLTPTTDHFQALMSLRAVLADGSLYQSPFQAMGAELLGACHRWGIGPYAEGLFSQGNFGIVTEGTFSLVRRPEHVEAFFLRIQDAEQLGEFVDSLRAILTSMGASVAGVNLMNARRVLSMSRPYPKDQVGKGEVIPSDMCQSMASAAGISAWTAAGVIHCQAGMRRAIRHEIRHLLPSSLPRPIYFNRRRLRFGNLVARSFPVGGSSVLQQLSSIESLLDLADGIPRRIALPLAYWLKGDSPNQSVEMNPAEDGCGLIWYSPLVPMKSKDVDQYVTMVERVCKANGIEPLITLTSLSPRLFDSTVPILFRPDEQGAACQAQKCYGELLEAGRKIGCLPYRVGVEQMNQVAGSKARNDNTLMRQLKQSIDPNRILAPGRYEAYVN